MRVAVTWLCLDLRRRWRSLLVLTLLVVLATGTVLAAIAGTRRGQTAFDRLWARTLPATATVLPNQPGFDWARVRALPEVTALSLFAVYYGASLEGFQTPTSASRPRTRQRGRPSSGPWCSRAGRPALAGRTRSR